MEETRTKKVEKNIVYLVLYQIIKIVLLFLNRIIFLKTLGIAYLGINSLFSNILTILSLADLGMSTSMMYSPYKPSAEKNYRQVEKYLNYFKKIYNYIAIVILFCGVLCIPFLKYIVNLPDNIPYIYLYYILLLLNTVFSYLFIYKITLLQADQKMYIVSKYDSIFQVLLFIIQIILLILFKNFGLYLLINLLITFSSNIVKAKAVDANYKGLINTNPKLSINEKEKKDVFSNIKSLLIYKIGGVIQTNTDNILISIFVGTITVGYYSNYNTITTQIVAFISLIFVALRASVGNFNVEKNKNEQYQMFNYLEVYNYWIVGACSIFLLTLTPTFIELCFGKEYVLSNLFLIFLILNFYTSNIRQNLWVYRETSGIFKKTKYVTLVTAIINIILSIILGYKFGIVGIVSATVLSRMIYAWWKEPIIIYKDIFEKKPNEYFTKYIFRLILVFIIYFIIELICNYINIKNLLYFFIIKIVISTIVTCIFYLLLYKNNPAFKYLIKKIRKAV